MEEKDCASCAEERAADAEKYCQTKETMVPTETVHRSHDSAPKNRSFSFSRVGLVKYKKKAKPSRRKQTAQ